MGGAGCSRAQNDYLGSDCRDRAPLPYLDSSWARKAVGLLGLGTNKLTTRKKTYMHFQNIRSENKQFINLNLKVDGVTT